MECKCIVSHTSDVYLYIGRFRWVYCQLETLRHCLPPSVRRILGELPETLDETYERVLREIHKTNRDHALRLLQCLTVAIRPLRVKELAEILAVDFDATRRDGIPKLNPDWRWEDQHKAVLSTCSSLITIVDEDGSQVVQFSHFSVKEFLTSERLAISSGDISRYHIDLEAAHTILAQACLGVLLRLDDRVDETNATDIPLVEYAARHWVDHAQFEKVSSRIRVAMEYFFDADKSHWSAWFRAYDIDNTWSGFGYSFETRGSPLYYAALCGFYDLVEHLVAKHPQDVIAEGGRNRTPLVAALYGNHLEVAGLLHQHGANIDVRDDEKRTPLYMASWKGLVDVVQWLLDHGADVDALDTSLYTPLQLASHWGYFKIVRMLLDHKADLNILDKYGRVALHDASYPYDSKTARDRLDITRLLLEYGADANIQDNEGSTPLHKSLTRGEAPLVEDIRLLLKYGANIDAKNDEGETALQIASAKGYDEIVEFLLENGASERRAQDPSRAS
jgi:ankyrin repeat protein